MRRAAPVVAAGLALVVAPVLVPPRDRARPADADLATIVDGRLQLDGGVGLPSKTLLAEYSLPIDALPLSGALSLRHGLPLNVSASLEFGEARLSMAGRSWTYRAARHCCDNTDTMAAYAAASGGMPPATAVGPLGVIPVYPGGGPPQNRMTLASLPPREADRLRGHAVGLDLGLRLQFTRHTLVGELPVRAGVAFRTNAYLLELVGIDHRAQVAVCRFTRFPTLDASPGPLVRFFLGEPRTRVLPLTPFWQTDVQRPGGSAWWAQGRTWATRMTLPLDVFMAENGRPDRGPTPPLPTASRRLYIVESRPAGALRTTIVARDVPVVDTSDPSFLGRRY